MIALKSCCFTGHRTIPDRHADSIIEQLELIIEQLIKRGITDFYCGGAVGFDTIAAIILIKYKTMYPQVRLILALPCENQDKDFSPSEKAVYNFTKSEADEIIYTEEKYCKGCMYKRDRYLVDNSDICVCYLKKRYGGTAYTVRYALQSKKKMIYVK